MKKRKVIILYSGGADSTLLIKLAQEQEDVEIVHAMVFDYGQLHHEELTVAKKQNWPFPVTLFNVPIGVKSKLTTGDGGYENVSPYHVPGRNLIFVAHAASFAESIGADEIWFGANYEDKEHQFPDCYQDWVFAVDNVLQINGSKSLKLRAPLLGMDKPMITSLLRAYGVKETDVFSGYGNL